MQPVAQDEFEISSSSSPSDPEYLQKQAGATELSFSDRQQHDSNRLLTSTMIKGHQRDGDASAWLQCLAAFFLMLNSFGLINSYGTFQAFYEVEILRSESASNLSWIGSLQTFLSLFGGIAAGPLFDRGYLRSLTCVGGFLVVLGMMLTSVCYSYWQFVLTQGLLVGLGCACLFTPGMAIVPQYFTKNRNLALGLATSGASLGGILYPIMFNQLLQRGVGFGWSCRILAFVILGTMMFAVAIVRWRGKQGTAAAKPSGALGAWKEPAYVMFTVCSFFGFMGIYVPFYYIQLYSFELQYVDPSLLGYIVSFLSLGSLFGRLIPPYLADMYDALTVAVIVILGLAVTGLCWIAVTSQAAIIAFCILFGFFSGAFLALGPAVVAYITTDMSTFGARVGMLLVPASIGTLIGNPIAGAVLTKNWLALQLFCGIVLIMSWMMALGSKGYLTWTKRHHSESL